MKTILSISKNKITKIIKINWGNKNNRKMNCRREDILIKIIIEINKNSNNSMKMKMIMMTGNNMLKTAKSLMKMMAR